MATVTALDDAIDEIIDELQTISGIRRVPDEPPEDNKAFPFAVVYPSTGLYEQIMTLEMRALHSINIELHIARQDLPRDYDKVMALIDVIPYELMKKLKDGNFTALDTFGTINYLFGPLSWGGVDTLGVTYTMKNVKVKTAIT